MIFEKNSFKKNYQFKINNMKITSDIKVESLILKGACIDGKIVQQVALIKKGLDIPTTHFFTSHEVKHNLDEFLKDVLDDKNAQYQIRTETPNEFDRSSDYFSESRLGLKYNEVKENLISVCKNNTLGIIQKLPPRSLNRNLISGLACLREDRKLHIDFLNGIATYLARVGICDGSVVCSIDNIENINENINLKSRKEQLENFIFTIMRYGIKFLKRSMDLPFDEKRDRIKKEYELTDEDLKREVVMKEKIEISKEIREIFSVNCGIDFDENSLKVCLIKAGIKSILESDEQDTARKFLLGEEISSDVYKFIVENILKLGDFILESHLVSFSLIESEGKRKFVIWDLPLDAKIKNTTSDIKNITWIESIDEFRAGENIGINLPITSNINKELISLCLKIKQETKNDTIYIKYYILSHLATLIREQGFEVVKYI